MSHFETPLLRYWRELNEALAALGADPVMFGDAILMRASHRNPNEAALTVIAGRLIRAVA